MYDKDLAFAPALELRQLIASKAVSPVEVAELYFRRIDELDPRLNSYLTLNRDEALASAKAAEQAVIRGKPLGPLHGVPVSIKDLELTGGLRTTSGSLVFKDRVPDEDSVVVERIRRSGGIILGKSNTPEFGLLGRTENRLGDHCRNPWNTDRTSGGSSGGGGASVAAGLCSMGTGSDGGGSTRIPASFCGVYGIKPTQGRVPYYSGAAAVPAANLFSQAGPLSRTVRDSALLLQVIAGHDPRDPTSLRDGSGDYVAAADRSVEGLRIAWSPDLGYAAVDPEVREAAEKAAYVFRELGCTVEEPVFAIDPPFDTFWALFSAVAYARNERMLLDHRDELTDYAIECYEKGAGVTGVDYVKGLGRIDALKAKFADLFDEFDLLLTPTMAVTAFPHGEPPDEVDGKAVHRFWGYLPFTYPINMIGYPAASIPCGFSAEGLPIGLHIVGRRLDEETIITASAAFEEARPWAQHRPPVS